MKKNIVFGIMIGFLILAISSCGLNKTTMADRVGYFEDDLNGSRTNIIDNIHSDAASYNTLDYDYWHDNTNIWDPSKTPFIISNLVEGSSSITADFAYSGSTGNTIYFELKDDGDFFSGENWKLLSCSINSGSNQF